jgi:hypothetical protein
VFLDRFIRCCIQLFILANIAFVELHGPDAMQHIYINPNEITSLREPLSVHIERWAKGTHCVLVMTNKNFIAVSETCDEVRQKLQTDPVWYP